MVEDWHNCCMHDIPQSSPVLDPSQYVIIITVYHIYGTNYCIDHGSFYIADYKYHFKPPDNPELAHGL